MRVNSELADTLGNLATRCTGAALLPDARVPKPPDSFYTAWMTRCVSDSHAKRNSVDRDRIVPDNVDLVEQDHLTVPVMIDALQFKVPESFDALEFDSGLEAIMEMLRETNAYFQRHEPWALQKKVRGGVATREDKEALNTVLYVVLESLRVAGILLQPVIPGSAKRLLDHLGVLEDKSERSLAAAYFGRDDMVGGSRVGSLSESEDDGTSDGSQKERTKKKEAFVLYAKRRR